MKTVRFTIHDLRFTRANRQRGIALIITLILLAVTLVMAIAFLAISRRERSSVTTYEDTATAKYAADAALARAEARIASQILMTTNPYVFGLMVSTNYINHAGFFQGVASPTNVNYDYYAPGGPAGPPSGADLAQNIANLFYDPRPPVFYGPNDFRFYLDLNRNGRFDTNGVVTNVYNDLSGVGTVSTNVGDPEWIGILEHPDQPHGPNNPFIARYCFIAVPANSLDLNYIHNQSLDAGGGTIINPQLGSGDDAYWRDQGVGTWEMNLAAFLTDLNTDRWDPPTLGNPLNEPYTFPERGSGNSIAFDDARSLVAWRYTNTYSTVASARGLFGASGYNAFEDDGIDGYGVGAQTTFDTNFSQPFYLVNNWPNLPWAGAASDNNYFSFAADLFDTNKADIGNPTVGDSSFVNNVYSAGTNQSTYDRYTFYRMLGQLGTDTLPAQGKLDLNYSNAIVQFDANGILTNFTIVPNSETNFTPWQPQDFFAAAANQMLRAYTTEWYESSPSNYFQTYYGLPTNSYNVISGIGLTNYPYTGITNQIPAFGITNIPVFVNGAFVYSPAVNRLLQLAANIYDASTNRAGPNTPNYPSVFRPVFWMTNEYSYALNQYVNDVYIRGYQYVGPISSSGNNNNIFAPPVEVNTLPLGISTSNVWGVPWIVGAKKGLPNFNGLEDDNVFFIERKLQFRRNSVAIQPSGSTFPFGRTYATNQMYIMGVSNTLAIEHWNSYAANFTDPVTIVAQQTFAFGLSNSAAGFVQVTNLYTTNNFYPAFQTNVWLASAYIFPLGTNLVTQNLSPQNSQAPAATNNLYVYYYTPTPQTLDGYTFTGPCFVPESLDPSNYMDLGTPPLPHMVMVTTNRLQAYVLDTVNPSTYYILDYVQLGGMNNSLDANQAIADADTPNGPTGLWSTNYYSGSTTPWGVVNQFLTSEIGGGVPSEDLDGGGSTEGANGVTGGGAWATTPVPGAGTDTGPAAQQAFFSAFFSASDEASYLGGILTNFEYIMQAPFTPMREIVQRCVYQANDPLVHYMTQDLYDFLDSTNSKYNIALPPPTIAYIGHQSDRYMPWSQGGNLDNSTFYGVSLNGASAYDLSYRDPLVWSSDNWDFPTNKYPTVGWLGRVHRGTPWQSVYLKSSDVLNESANQPGPVNVGIPTWQLWTGNVFNSYDAANAAPVQDWLLFDLFTAAPDDDATRGQLSVNIGADQPGDPLAGLASWSALLSGTLALSNNVNDLQLPRNVGYESPSPILTLQHWPGYSIWTNQPLGKFYPNGIATNSPLGWIVNGINSTRTTTNWLVYTNVDHLQGIFEHVGDILATPQLSVASPFLNSSDQVQEKDGISDEMYEWLPQQIMGLLTVSGTSQNPPRYVVYCYGQTLKPAPNSLVPSGSLFGLCTNYQVVAESAARVVLRVDNAPTPANPNAQPHVVVEQYNPLPPE